MILDSSALVAVLQREDPHAEDVAAALAGDRSPVMCAANVVETLIVLTNRFGNKARVAFDRLAAEISLGIQPLTADHVAVAHRAYITYGKGRHPAALNYGDTMAYATAKLAGEPLIAVGNDFTRTDLLFNGVIGNWPN